MAKEDTAALDEWPTADPSAMDGGEVVRANERRFRQEFGPAPFGLFVTSLAAAQPNCYLAVNDAYCRLTGYPRRELAGADFLGDCHPDEQPVLEALIGKIMSGETRQIQANTRLICKNGDIACVRLTGSAIQPARGEPYLAAYVEDTTAVEQAQAELHQLERELMRSRRMDSLGQLVGGIAHDFNNMLTVITNYASLVRDEVTIAEATESATRWGPVRWDIEQIEEATDRAKRLIKHLLAYSQREQARPAPVDVSRLINDVTGLLGEVLGEHVPVITRHGAGLWPVQADPGLLEQAIINIGMDAVTADRAFEPFFTTRPGDQAAGLGLPAVRRTAAQTGGKAWLRSEPGKGTTVTMMLPAAPGSPTAWGTASHPGRVTEHAGAVLVVDDEAAIREVAHRVLTSAGYQVTTAANGQEALRLLRDPATPANLVLTDVVMPGMTGKAFAAQAQQMRPGIRMMFMSGYEQQATSTESWPQPGTQVIAKPFSRAALLARVTQVLAADIGTGDTGQRAQPVRAEYQ